ncbi:MAG: carboxypeptidase-like regulatory domain-containing protein, partial [Chitinophagaceae bacterium]
MSFSLRSFCFILISILLITWCDQLYAQKTQAQITGKVVDDNENPMANVSVMILGKLSGVVTNDSGKFKITVPSDKALALVFSSSGFRTEQRNFFLNNQETENIIVRMEKSTKTMDAIVISAQPDRRETGLIRMNPKNALVIPSTIGG